MYLFKKYVEICTTMDLTKLFTAKNLLRLSFNNFRGSNALLSRGGFVKNIYSLSVEKKNEQTARGLLTGL